MNEIGKRIAEARVAKGMNQSELARALGVTPQSVQKWEAGGAPKGARLREIAQVLGTTVEYLLTGSVTVVRKFLHDAADRMQRRPKP